MAQIGWVNGTFDGFELATGSDGFDTNGYQTRQFGVIGTYTTNAVWSYTWSGPAEGDPSNALYGPGLPGSWPNDNGSLPVSAGWQLTGGSYAPVPPIGTLVISCVVDGVPATNTLEVIMTPNYDYYTYKSWGYTLLGPSIFWTDFKKAVES